MATNTTYARGKPGKASNQILCQCHLIKAGTQRSSDGRNELFWKRQPFMHKNKGLGLLQEAALEGKSLRMGFMADASHCWCLPCSRRVDRFIQKEQLWVLSRALQLLLGLNWKTPGLWFFLETEIQVPFIGGQTMWGGEDSKGHPRDHPVSKMFGICNKTSQGFFFLPLCREF